MKVTKKNNPSGNFNEVYCSGHLKRILYDGTVILEKRDNRGKIISMPVNMWFFILIIIAKLASIGLIKNVQFTWAKVRAFSISTKKLLAFEQGITTSHPLLHVPLICLAKQPSLVPLCHRTPSIFIHFDRFLRHDWPLRFYLTLFPLRFRRWPSWVSSSCILWRLSLMID